MLSNTVSSFGHFDIKKTSISWSKSTKAGQVLVTKSSSFVTYRGAKNLTRTALLFFPLQFCPIITETLYLQGKFWFTLGEVFKGACSLGIS